MHTGKANLMACGGKVAGTQYTKAECFAKALELDPSDSLGVESG